MAFEADWSMAVEGVHAARIAMGSAPSRTLAALAPLQAAGFARP
jgi:hypothetical protein